MEPIDATTHFSLVDVRFEAVPEGTSVTICQEQIESAEAHEMHLHGWIGCVAGLDAVLAAQ